MLLLERRIAVAWIDSVLNSLLVQVSTKQGDMLISSKQYAAKAWKRWVVLCRCSWLVAAGGVLGQMYMCRLAHLVYSIKFAQCASKQLANPMPEPACLYALVCLFRYTSHHLLTLMSCLVMLSGNVCFHQCHGTADIRSTSRFFATAWKVANKNPTGKMEVCVLGKSDTSTISAPIPLPFFTAIFFVTYSTMQYCLLKSKDNVTQQNIKNQFLPATWSILGRDKLR